MGWPAQLHTHPAFDTLERKCRRFMGVFSNEEERLGEDGVDLSETRQFISDLWPRAQAMDEAAEKDSAARAAYEAEAQRLDPELQQRFAALVKLIERYHPDSGVLVNCKIYSTRWLECVGEPRRELPPEDSAVEDEAEAEDEEADDTWETPAYGMSWSALRDLRQAIWNLKLKDEQTHRDAAAWLVFLGGLLYAAERIKRDRPAPLHAAEDGLREASLEAWQEGVDFALRDESVALLEQHSAILGSIEAGQMYLAATYSARIHTAEVYAWLHERDFRDALQRLIFAMGVHAATTPYGRQLRMGLASADEILRPLFIETRLITVLKHFVEYVESLE